MRRRAHHTTDLIAERLQREGETREAGDPILIDPQVKFKVINMSNDYVTAVELRSDGTDGVTTREIAKPDWLRHGGNGEEPGNDASRISVYHPNITSVTTIGPNEIEASDGSTTETVVVYPPLVANGQVKAEPVEYSGVNGSDGKDLKWELVGSYGWKVKPS